MGKLFSLFPHRLMILLPAGILITFLCSRSPQITENLYSMGLYKIISSILSALSNAVEISLGEFLLYGFLLFIFFRGLRFYRNFFCHQGSLMTYLLFLLRNVAVYFSIIYFVFLIAWGINYHRLPFAVHSNLKPGPSSLEDLQSLCQDLIHRANALRTKNFQSDQGVTYIPDHLNSVPRRANKGFAIVGEAYPVLQGKEVFPKPVFFSTLMSYAGIAGIFSPFTGEANFNPLLPDVQLPSTITHEIAHQRGFAREDEANFIAYLTCIHHPDVDFQYSGVLLALSHSMGKLYQYNQEQYFIMTQNYSHGLKKDLKNIKDFWAIYEGPLERLSARINNFYLKSNLQEQGIGSYGQMVDLLLADFKERRENK